LYLRGPATQTNFQQTSLVWQGPNMANVKRESCKSTLKGHFISLILWAGKGNKNFDRWARQWNMSQKYTTHVSYLRIALLTPVK
jgi:hypothetical protein